MRNSGGMTDVEIIKAWEKILATGDAPIGEHWSCGGVVTTKLAKETFDMLTRQKAQIEGLQDEVVTKTDMLNGQKAEIERLQNESFCFANERDAYKDTLDTAVTEAIKEFWERVKNDLREVPYVLPSMYIIGDKILKEMVGDIDG